MIDLVSEVGAPVEIMFPVDGRLAGIGEDVGIRLLHFPVVGEAIVLVMLLRRVVLVGAITGIVIFEERYRPVFPGVAIGGVADHAEAVAEPVPDTVISLVVLQGKLRREIEDAAGCLEIARFRRRMPHPPALFVVGTPVILADGERRVALPVVDGYPLGVKPMDHIVAPTAVAEALQVFQVTDDVATNIRVGVVDIAKGAILIRGAAMIGVFGRAFLPCATFAIRRTEAA